MAESLLADLGAANRPTIRIATTPEEYLAEANRVHAYSIDNKKALRNEDGSITTALADALEVTGPDGALYIATVPRYDPDKGRPLNDKELRERFEPRVLSGEIPVVPAKWDGSPDEHPARLWPRINHDNDAYNPENARASIGYDMSGSKPSLGK